MSYSGYTQALCINGHQFSIDQYEEPFPCPYCGADRAWTHEVDQTNGCYCDDKTLCPSGITCPAHPLPLKVKKEAEYKICPTCHQKEMVSQPTYEIPEDE